MVTLGLLRAPTKFDSLTTIFKSQPKTVAFMDALAELRPDLKEHSTLALPNCNRICYPTKSDLLPGRLIETVPVTPVKDPDKRLARRSELDQVEAIDAEVQGGQNFDGSR